MGRGGYVGIEKSFVLDRSGPCYIPYGWVNPSNLLLTRTHITLAAITNPTEASFRSHLTELSFRRHLADIHTTDDGNTAEDEPSLPTSTEAPSAVVGGTETPTIAPFRFANHVAISLRTPPLHYKTLFFFSFALNSPLAPPIYLSDPTPLNKKHATPLPKERFVLFIGYFGHWVWLGHIPRRVEWLWRLFTDGTREKGKKKNAYLERSGVMELRAVANKEEQSSIGNLRFPLIPFVRSN